MYKFFLILLLGWTVSLQTHTYIAHRGADKESPENTMGAFEKMYSHGAKWFEIDCHLSKDGEVVLIHDPDLERTTDGKGHISEKFFADLRELNAALGYEQFGFQKIPTLKELIAFARANAICLSIEVKGDDLAIVPLVHNLIMQENRPDQFLVYAFSQTIIEEFIRQKPPYRIQWNQEFYGKHLHDFAIQHGIGINLDHKNASPEVVRTLTEAGIPVHMFTVNDLPLAEAYFKVGVEAVITDTLISGVQ